MKNVRVMAGRGYRGFCRLNSATGLDGREIEPLKCILVLGKVQFPERKEIFPDIQSFLESVGTVQDLIACINAELFEVLGYLREVIEVYHLAPSFYWQGPSFLTDCGAS